MPADFLGLAGKAVLVMGVANRKSVAFHTGKVLRAAGAKVLWSCHSEARRDELRKKLIPDEPLFVCDVEKQEQIDRLAARLPEGVYRQVRYEDLCRGTAVECESIFAFLGLEPLKATLAMDETPHHILGNAMRLGAIDAIKLDETWRHEMDQRSERIFESVAGVQNRRYGYV